MDSFGLDSQGFVNLLASQSSQTFDVDSHEVPRFSTQSSEDATKTVERRKWSQTDDIVLISAWLNTSKDPILSNEQRAGAFWKRIREYFNASPKLSGLLPREASHCKQRWGRLNERVCKFVGCHGAALKEKASGQSDNDVMKAAHDIFVNDYGKAFTLEHAWRELRFDQKWMSTCVVNDGAKEKRKETSEPEVEEVGSEARPPGVKACKAAKRKKHGNEAAMEKMQGMLDVKDKISNKKILEILLTKTEPLSDIEVDLKNKLIAEML